MNENEQQQLAGTRICSNPECESGGQAQPLDKEHFAPDQRYAGGFRAECRPCERRRAKAYNQAHPKQVAKNTKRWVERNREHVNDKQRKRYRQMADALKREQQQTA